MQMIRFHVDVFIGGKVSHMCSTLQDPEKSMRALRSFLTSGNNYFTIPHEGPPNDRECSSGTFVLTTALLPNTLIQLEHVNVEESTDSDE